MICLHSNHYNGPLKQINEHRLAKCEKEKRTHAHTAYRSIIRSRNRQKRTGRTRLAVARVASGQMNAAAQSAKSTEKGNKKCRPNMPIHLYNALFVDRSSSLPRTVLCCALCHFLPNPASKSDRLPRWKLSSMIRLHFIWARLGCVCSRALHPLDAGRGSPLSRRGARFASGQLDFGWAKRALCVQSSLFDLRIKSKKRANVDKCRRMAQRENGINKETT